MWNVRAGRNVQNNVGFIFTNEVTYTEPAVWLLGSLGLGLRSAHSVTERSFEEGTLSSALEYC